MFDLLVVNVAKNLTYLYICQKFRSHVAVIDYKNVSNESRHFLYKTALSVQLAYIASHSL